MVAEVSVQYLEVFNGSVHMDVSDSLCSLECKKECCGANILNPDSH